MKTEILNIDPLAVEERDIARVAGFLSDDEVIVFPTDTYYGLGGNGLSRKVIRRVFELKRREQDKPLLVLVSGADMVRELAGDIPLAFGRAVDAYWPGPLTVILRASSRIPPELGAGTGTVAMRLPDVSWLRKLVGRAGFPLIATSANLSGRSPVSTARDAAAIFRGKVALIVDGGTTPGGAPSTVLDLSAGPPRVVREGALPASELLARL